VLLVQEDLNVPLQFFPVGEREVTDEGDVALDDLPPRGRELLLFDPPPPALFQKVHLHLGRTIIQQ